MFKLIVFLIYYILTLLIYILPRISIKIKISKILANYVWKNDIGIYSLNKIEKYINSKILKIIELKSLKISTNNFKKNTLQILTCAYSSGGHTRVCEEFAQFKSLGNNEVLFTSNHSNEESLKFFKEKKIILTIIKENKLKEKISLICNKVLEFENVILHIHPDDIETVCALYIAKKLNNKLKIYLYNHADHVCSYGYDTADVVLEISKLGWMLGEKRNIINKRSFAGIPINFNYCEVKVKKNNLQLLSVGRVEKYQPNKEKSFFKFIDLLFLNTNLNLTIVGVTENSNKIWMEYKLKYHDRLILLGVLSATKLAAITKNYDLYIDSFPVTGGTTFPKLFVDVGMGIGIESPLQGYSPACQINVKNEKELVEFIENINQNINKLNIIKKDIIDFHDINTVDNRLFKLLKNNEYLNLPQLIDVHCNYLYLKEEFYKNKKIYYIFEALSRNIKRKILL